MTQDKFGSSSWRVDPSGNITSSNDAPTGQPGSAGSRPDRFAPYRPTAAGTDPGRTPESGQSSIPQSSAPQSYQQPSPWAAGQAQNAAGATSVPSAQQNPYAGPASTPPSAPRVGYAGSPSQQSGYSAQQAPVLPSRVTTTERKRGPGWGALIGAMVVTALFSAGVTWGLSEYRSDASTSSASQPVVEDVQSGSEVIPPVNQSSQAPDWEAVAAAVRPATVAIMVEGRSGSASGSGVVFDSDGHIITNYHVVSSALDEGTLTVTTHDGRLYEATIVGTDSTTDLAVLALTTVPDDLVAARFATSETLQVGQPIMAVGAPLGLADTVTTGVISALDRPVTVESTGAVDPSNPMAGTQTELVVTNAIQIDASLNPGNSGGPLFDATGGVIGINSSIASTSSSASEAGSIGLGFAIPVDLVKSVAQQIISTGKVEHALLGVQIQTGVAASGSATYMGAQVVEVVAGGAAEEAGLLPGDVVIGIDGHSVTSGPALTGFVRRYTAGQEVTLEILRNGQEMTTRAVLRARDA